MNSNEERRTANNEYIQNICNLLEYTFILLLHMFDVAFTTVICKQSRASKKPT
jgi:hypothetical protein